MGMNKDGENALLGYLHFKMEKCSISFDALNLCYWVFYINPRKTCATQKQNS
jgi:hypothetical protein